MSERCSEGRYATMDYVTSSGQEGLNMRHEQIAIADNPTVKTLNRFDQIAREMSLKMGNGCRLREGAECIRAYYNDRELLGPMLADANWRPRFLEFAQARIALDRFVNAVETLRGLTGLKRILNDVLNASITQDFEPSSAKDKLYELELAATLKIAGFHVELREPDIVASGNGLSRPLAIACKFPSSRYQIHEHISNGYRQITKQNLDGAVAIGIDLIIGKEQRLHGVLDFGIGNLPPEEILDRRLVKEILTLEKDRKTDYPSERPLDGLIMTAAIVAKDRDSPALTFLNIIRLGCLPGNPLGADLAIVKENIEAIRTVGP
jgi:hypothetical protein